MLSKARPVLLILILWLTMTGTAHAALGETILRQGARGSDVWQLQQQLRQLDLLPVEPTGYFGSLTDGAVRKFQADNGLVVDGLIGPLTAGALTEATHVRVHIVAAGDSLWLIATRYATDVSSLKAVNDFTSDLIYPGQQLRLPRASNPSRGGYSHSEIELLARLVHAEASGEPYLGKVAVAAVVLNRVDSHLFPNGLREVIYQPYQFEPVLNGRIDGGFAAEDMRATQAALSGTDPTGGALFFYNPGKVSHRWMAARRVIVAIGQHVFSR